MKLMGWCKILIGQRITIPKEVRKYLRLNVGDAVGFWLDGDRIIIGAVDVKIKKRVIK